MRPCIRRTQLRSRMTILPQKEHVHDGRNRDGYPQGSGAWMGPPTPSKYPRHMVPTRNFESNDNGTAEAGVV